MRTTRIFLLVMAWVLVFAVGCKKNAVDKMAFKSALNSYYSGRQNCLWAAPVKFPAQADTSNDEQTKGYDALTDAGLLTRKAEEKKRFLIGSKQVNDYDLSDKGRSSWTPDTTQPGYGNFCYGHPEVTSIDGFTPADDTGTRYSVTYHCGRGQPAGMGQQRGNEDSISKSRGRHLGPADGDREHGEERRRLANTECATGTGAGQPHAVGSIFRSRLRCIRPLILAAMFMAIRRGAAWALLAAGIPVFSFGQAGSGSEKHSQKPGTGATAGGTQNTAGPHPLQVDAQHRPITMGGFVKTGPVVFEDASQKAGLAKWTHKMGTPSKTYIVETKGSGVGLLDFDNDGWLDIYVVNGSTFNALDGKETPPHAALFHNNHDGTFTDVAAKAGVTNDRWGFGVAIADYDNDGWPDMFVSNWGKNRLYHNNHDGTFTDVADKAGVGLDDPAAWHTGATWGDYDGDGRLDLFVAGYLHYDRHNLPTAGESGVPNAFCTFRGEKVSCGPRGLKGEGDHLFRNNGDGTFIGREREGGRRGQGWILRARRGFRRHQQ